MLEGLEIVEVDFLSVSENKDERTDSDFWTKQPRKNPRLNYEKIGNCLIQSQYGISISMNEDKQGYPIYRMNEIHNMLCDLEVDKCADIPDEEMRIFELNDRDVLFNRTNSYEWVGRTGLYKKIDAREFVFASYLVRFRPDESILLPEYLTTFLNTKYGVWDVKRRARQSINQTNVNPEEVKQIDIPLLSLDFQSLLKNRFDSAFESTQKASVLYQQAEILLLKTLGMADFTPSSEAVNIKSFNKSFGASGRLDAEYYQPKYEQVVAHIKAQAYQHLIDLVDIQKSVEPGSDAYCDDGEEGLPFLRVADYNKHGLTPPQKHLKSSYVSENWDKLQALKPRKNTILFSKDGSVGEAYCLTKDLEAVTSGAVLHLSVKNADVLLPEYLTLALNSKLVKMQSERDAGGSIILHWRVSEIENVVVPLVDMTIQRQIADLVQQSFALKEQSTHLLDVAKRAVEIAIEQDEAAAMVFVACEVNDDNE